VLVTGFDIIFFWVARMIMMGLKFMGDVPFHEVYIHGLIRDHDGQKMSKSKGNILDPLDLIDGVGLEELLRKRTTGLMQDHLKAKIEKATRKEFPDGIDQYGADALRYTFAALATTGRDIRFDLGRIEGYKNFCNKIWNAARYVLMNTEDISDGDAELSAADRWIRSRFDQTVTSVHDHFRTYRLDLAAKAIYEFTWNEFCDWYLELSKPVLQSGDASDAQKRGTQQTLIGVLEALLRLIHPLMPFITEEIWQQVAPRAGVPGDTIMTQPFPQASGEVDEDAIADMEWVKGFISGVRQVRGEMNISPGKALTVLMENASDDDWRLKDDYEHLLKRVGRVEHVGRLREIDNPPPSATALLGDTKLLVQLGGVIDVDAERARLDKQKQKVAADLAKTKAKLGNENFVNNAPPAVVTQEREREAEFGKVLAQLDEQIEKLAELS
ncbi:MAG: class I tRNA ligase family protein, partial [Woeseiaceae bacterium]|nr:class I tRNA ligase family protein [Woeseiaceae bacterium]